MPLSAVAKSFNRAVTAVFNFGMDYIDYADSILDTCLLNTIAYVFCKRNEVTLAPVLDPHAILSNRSIQSGFVCLLHGVS